jgi:hypothetical protein
MYVNLSAVGKKIDLRHVCYLIQLIQFFKVTKVYKLLKHQTKLKVDQFNVNKR